MKTINKFRVDQLEEMITTFANSLPSHDKTNYIKILFSDQVDQFPIMDQLKNNKKKLVIGDDIINNKHFNQLMEIYFTRERHYNVSCIYLTQNFTLVPLTIRRNLSNLFLFKTDGRNLNDIYTSVVQSFMADRDNFKALCNRIWSTKYSYVFINRVDGKITSDVFKPIN